MATRSTIALEYADGTVHQIYCHWNGYPSYNGKKLKCHYTDPFLVKEMMNLGDMSSLGDTLYSCEFYGRDRGESDTGRRKFSSYCDYQENRQSEEYDYILRTDGKWYYSDHGKNFVELV